MAPQARRPHCTTSPQPPLDLPASMPLGRQRALMVGAPKWANGTTLHYAFFDPAIDPDWAPPPGQADAVRKAFKTWEAVGLGLKFVEVEDLGEAEVRIGFLAGDGSWSYIGRAILAQPASRRTMNFGWSLTETPWGEVTALHEIGHTLGMPHEHQSPLSGIVWNEQAVYKYFAGDPNFWTREETFHNVIRKLHPAQVEGSDWDPESVMEYPFVAGLILEPAEYSDGIEEPDGISDLDVEWMRKWYPGDGPAPAELVPFDSAPLELAPAEQADFRLSLPESRKYEIATFGDADTVIVLFEEIAGELRYVAGDDDGGQDRNAHLEQKLFQGRNYVLKVRLYWAGSSGRTAVMYW